MFARSLRNAFLLVAAWALMFAPGAVGGETGGEERLLDSDHIAAAVVAPTFEPDALISGRLCQSDDDEVGEACRGETGPLPVAVVVVSDGLDIRNLLARPGVPIFSALVSLAPRAPPVS